MLHADFTWSKLDHCVNWGRSRYGQRLVLPHSRTALSLTPAARIVVCPVLTASRRPRCNLILQAQITLSSPIFAFDGRESKLLQCVTPEDLDAHVRCAMQLPTETTNVPDLIA